jgi:hypothetical protein
MMTLHRADQIGKQSKSLKQPLLIADSAGVTSLCTVEVQGGAAVGVIAGLIIAGAVFGDVATFHDIRDNIRRMAWPKG